MSDEKQETMADIVAMLRANARGERFDEFSFTSLADRIETAWKRDEERAVEHATRHAEAVARDNCRDCVHNPRGRNYEGGNAAAMREALVVLRDAARIFCHQILNSKYNDIMDTYKCRERGFPALLDLRAAIPRANFALSAPPRQCDVGTAEEQAKRFNDFCSTHTCNKCVVYDKMAHSFNDIIPERAFSCRLVFSQLPYEAEEGETDGV